MKKFFGLIVLLCFITGCAKHSAEDSTSKVHSFYYSNQNQGLYEFTGNQQSSLSNQPSFSTNAVSLSSSSDFTLNKKGIIPFSPKSSASIIASTANDALNIIYYVTSRGYLYKFNTQNESSTVIKRIFPIPRQLIYDDYRNTLLYHDRQSVYSFDLSDNTITKKTTKMFPIQTIAFDKPRNKLYFSTINSGKIYIINENRASIIYKTMSVFGSSISFDPTYSELYFTRTNGRDTQINSLNTYTNEISEKITLYRVNLINTFMMKH